MTFAGKTLKDIFDEGISRLLGLEKDQSAKLRSIADNHHDSRKSGEDSSLVRLEDKSKELEGQIRTLMEESTQRVKTVIDNELEETKSHLSSVREELKSHAEKLKSSVDDLRNSYLERIEHIGMGLSNSFESIVEQSTVNLQNQDFTTSKHVRSHGTYVLNTLQQKLDHSLWESRGEEKQYNSTLFKTFMQKANVIDTSFTTKMQFLSNDFQTIYKELEDKVNACNQELMGVAPGLKQNIDDHATKLEEEIRQFFQKVLEDNKQAMNEGLNNIAQDLSSVHDNTTRSLNDRTQEFTNGLIVASGESSKSLNERCMTMKERIDSASMDLRRRLDERVRNSSAQQEALEKEKENIFDGLRMELTTIKQSFELKLAELAKESLGKVNEMTREAEAGMISKHDSCVEELRQESEQAKTNIDESLRQFLTEISDQKIRALSEISKAAGDTAAVQSLKTSEPPRQRKVRRGKDADDKAQEGNA